MSRKIIKPIVETISGTYRVTTMSGTPVIGPVQYGPYFTTTEDTLWLSEGHLWPVPDNLDYYLDSGGDFQVFHRYLRPGFTAVDLKYVNNGLGTISYLSGTLAPFSFAESDWPALSGSPSDLASFATTAFKRTIPTQPRAQALQFIAELRQLPKLPALGLMKDKAKYFRNLHRNIGSEYLNVKFGWQPFISDVKKITASTLKKKKAIANFTNNSGKLVRRRYDFPDSETSGSPIILDVLAPNPNGLAGEFFIPGSCKLTLHTQSKTRTWFSAGYTYYIGGSSNPWLNNVQRGEQIMNHLYGTRLDPSTLWELAPWSWLADYFSNVGDIVNNFTRFSQDNLVAKYAYIMRETIADKHCTFVGLDRSGNSVVTGCTLRSVFKRRYRANPYGLAFNSSLTSNQTNILAALALSKSPRR